MRTFKRTLAALLLAFSMVLGTGVTAFAEAPKPLPDARPVGIAPVQPTQQPSPAPLPVTAPVPSAPTKTSAPSGATTTAPAPLPAPRPGGGVTLTCPTTLDQVLWIFHLDATTYGSHWTEVTTEAPHAWHYFWSGHSISATLPNGFSADTLSGSGQTGFVQGDVLTLRCNPNVPLGPAPLPGSRPSGGYVYPTTCPATIAELLVDIKVSQDTAPYWVKLSEPSAYHYFRSGFPITAFLPYGFSADVTSAHGGSGVTGSATDDVMTVRCDSVKVVQNAPAPLPTLHR